MNEITSEIKKLIEKNALAFATIDENGNPHCIAVGYIKVVSENQIIISVIHIIQTLKNIKRNNNVVLVVWNRNWEDDRVCEGYELKGKAEYFTFGKWKEFVDNLPENKDENPRGAILITVEKIKKLA